MIRTRHRDQEITQFEDLAIFLFPLTGFTLFVYLLLAPVFTFLIMASGTSWFVALRTFPIWIAAVCALIHYGFVILEYTSRGRQLVPRLTWDMLTAQFNARLAKELLFLSVWVSFIFTFENPSLQLVMITVSLLIFPAATSYIGLQDNFISAINPVQLFQFIRHMGFGPVSVKLLVIESILAALLFLGIQQGPTASFFSLFLGTFAAVYLILMLFRCIGVLLHSRRKELGLLTEFSPEQVDAERQDQVDSKRSDIFFDLHGLSQRGNTKKAWQMLEAALQENEYQSEAEYFHRISEWDNPLLLLKMAQGYIDRLLKSNDMHTAWQIFESCHNRSQGKFQLSSGKSVIDLCKHAYSRDHSKIAVAHLGHFQKDFPKHPGLKDALYLAVQICCEDLNDFEQGRVYLRAIKEKFPNAPQEERYQTLSDLLVT